MTDALPRGETEGSGAVLVTGGAGYLGSLVLPRLAADGVRTVCLDRRAPSTRHPRLETVVADLRSIDLATLLRDNTVTSVVHLAAIVEPPRGMSEAELADIEVGGTRRVIEACVATGVRQLVVTSSGAAYGYLPRNDGHLLTEDESVPGSPQFAYSRHKAAVEALLAHARRLHPELGQLVLRPGTILGARTDNQITSLFTGRFVLDLGGTHGPFSFVWDEDVAEVIVRGVRGNRTGIYNLAGDGVLTMPQIARIEHTPVLALPAGLVRGLLRLTRRAGLGRFGPEQVDFVVHRPVLDNTRLRRDFPGLPSKTTREVYEIFRSGRRG